MRDIICSSKALIDRIMAEHQKEGETWVEEIEAGPYDRLSEKEIQTIVESETPYETMTNILAEMYEADASSVMSEIVKGLVKEIMADKAFPAEYEGIVSEYTGAYISDIVRFGYPVEHFMDQEVCVNIMVNTGDVNYDFTLNSVFPCSYGSPQDNINDEAAIVWLANQQGYNKTKLKAELRKGDMTNPHGFLESLRVELANLPSHMSVLTFLVRMPLRQLLDLNTAIRWAWKHGSLYTPKKTAFSGYIVLDKDVISGLYDPWYGSGSCLDLEFEKDIKLPINYIWLATPDGGREGHYSIEQTFGLLPSAWRRSVKELHIAKGGKTR